MRYAPKLLAPLAFALCLLSGGCRSGIETSGAAFGGPPLQIAEADEWQVVRAQAPSPGWKIDFEHSRPGPAGLEVFITMRRPDPRFVYPQVVVEQVVATDVRIDEPITVFARIVEHDHSGVTGTYYFVEQTTK